MSRESSEKFWYNSRTGVVEYGMQSQNIDRVGPFDSRAEAEAAPALLKGRSDAWRQEEREQD